MSEHASSAYAPNPLSFAPKKYIMRSNKKYIWCLMFRLKYDSVDTHTASVHASVADSILKLKSHFVNTCLDRQRAVIKLEIKAFIASNPEYFASGNKTSMWLFNSCMGSTKAQHILYAVNYICNNRVEERATGVELRDLFTMCWLSISSGSTLLVDQNAINDCKKRFLDNIYEGSREYMRSYLDRPAKVNFTCDPGWFNKLIYSLQGSVHCVTVTVQTKDQFCVSTKYRLEKHIKDFAASNVRADSLLPEFLRCLLKSENAFADTMRNLIKEYYIFFKFVNQPTDNALKLNYPETEILGIYRTIFGCNNFADLVELINYEQIFQAELAKQKIYAEEDAIKLQEIATRLYKKTKLALAASDRGIISDYLKFQHLELDHLNYDKYYDIESKHMLQENFIRHLHNVQLSNATFGEYNSAVHTIAAHLNCIVDLEGYNAADIALVYLLQDPDFATITANIIVLNLHKTGQQCFHEYGSSTCRILELKKGQQVIYCDPATRIYSVSNLSDLRIQLLQELYANEKKQYMILEKHIQSLYFSKCFADICRTEPVRELIMDYDDPKKPFYNTSYGFMYRVYDDAQQNNVVCIDEQTQDFLRNVLAHYAMQCSSYETVLHKIQNNDPSVQQVLFPISAQYKKEYSVKDKELLQIIYDCLLACKLWAMYPNNPHACTYFATHHAKFFSTFKPKFLFVNDAQEVFDAVSKRIDDFINVSSTKRKLTPL